MSEVVDPSKLRVADLRAELQARGLDTKGNKPVLVERLREALEAEAEAAEEGEEGTAAAAVDNEVVDKELEQEVEKKEEISAADQEEEPVLDLEPERELESEHDEPALELEPEGGDLVADESEPEAEPEPEKEPEPKKEVAPDSPPPEKEEEVEEDGTPAKKKGGRDSSPEPSPEKEAPSSKDERTLEARRDSQLHDGDTIAVKEEMEDEYCKMGYEDAPVQDIENMKEIDNGFDNALVKEEIKVEEEPVEVKEEPSDAVEERRGEKRRAHSRSRSPESKKARPEVEEVRVEDEPEFDKTAVLLDWWMDTKIFYKKKEGRKAEDEESSDSDYDPSEHESEDSTQSCASSDELSDEDEIDEFSDDEDLQNETNVSIQPQNNWKPISPSTRLFPFTGKEELCIQPASDSNDEMPMPIDVFNLFISDDVIDHIVRETNRYASQCIANATITRRSSMKEWKDTSSEEIRKFIGILIYMGLVPKPEIPLYWSKRTLYAESFVPNIMPRVRFRLLLKFIHFNNNEGALSQQDKLHKIRPLVDMMSTKYQEVYKPGSEVVIDESMVAFRGRAGIRQYLPGKSHKYGLKLYKVCTPEAYTWNFEIHSGKTNQIDGLNGTESRTVKLTENILNKGATIYADNYYCSVVLAEYLLKKKTFLCGTIRKNRKHLSHEVITAKLKKKEMKSLENRQGVKLYNWRDKRNVFMISTVPEHGDSLVPSGKTNRNNEETRKPECVLAYNTAKKGVDVSDQMTSYHTPLRRSLKWYRKAAFEIIAGMSVVNAHVLYNKYFTRKPMQIRHFRDSLVLSLTHMTEKDQRPGRASSAIEGKTFIHALSEPDKKDKIRKRCRGCYEKISLNEGSKAARNNARRVTTFCDQCEDKPHLCISCFAEKHQFS